MLALAAYISRPRIVSSGLPVIRIGSFLRQSRLDELPIMERAERSHKPSRSAVERREFVDDARDSLVRRRHTARPGLTGWAQVTYKYRASREDAMERLQYELFYIKNMLIALDVYIILKTVKTVVLSRGTRSSAAPYAAATRSPRIPPHRPSSFTRWTIFARLQSCPASTITGEMSYGSASTARG